MCEYYLEIIVYTKHCALAFSQVAPPLTIEEVAVGMLSAVATLQLLLHLVVEERSIDIYSFHHIPCQGHAKIVTLHITQVQHLRQTDI